MQTRPKYTEDLRALSDHFQFGFLPHPQAIEIDKQFHISKIFPNDHLDRVATFIRGKIIKVTFYSIVIMYRNLKLLMEIIGLV